jgi:hypothetical protein
MTKRCDMRFYKSFLPRRQPSDLTAKQIEKLKDLNEVQASKYLSMLSDIDDDAYKVMNVAMSVSPRRIAQMSDLGKTTTEMIQEAETTANKLLASAPASERMSAQEVGERLLMNLKKGEVMDPAARTLATKSFENMQANLPLLNKQLLNALETGNDTAAVALLNRWVDSMAITAGYVGDGNAWSKAGNMRKYYKQQMKKNADIDQLFREGKC